MKGHARESKGKDSQGNRKSALFRSKIPRARKLNGQFHVTAPGKSMRWQTKAQEFLACGCGVQSYRWVLLVIKDGELKIGRYVLLSPGILGPQPLSYRLSVLLSVCSELEGDMRKGSYIKD